MNLPAGDPPGTRHVEARWRAFWDAAPFVLLAVSTGIVLTRVVGQPWSARLVTLGVAGLAAGWMWFFVVKHPPWLRRLGPTLGYFTVLFALSVVLLLRDTTYVFLVGGVFVQVLSFLPSPWVYPGAVLCALLLVSPGYLGHPHLVRQLPGLVVTVSWISAIGLFTRAVTEMSERRREALAGLERAQARNIELQSELIAQAREAGIQVERTRLAGEIHDTIAQALIGIIAQLEAASQWAEQPETRRRLDTARTLARESLAEARRSVQALHPPALDGAQLPGALTETAERWSATYSIPVHICINGPVRALHPEAEVTLLRVAGEGLANVARHAKAGRVDLTLSYMDDVVVLDVRDDGVGFDPQAVADPQAGRFGLLSMRTRVARLGGTLAVESAVGQGATISAKILAIPAAPGPDR